MIAVLGASGYIGRSLGRLLAANGDSPVHLFARQPDRLVGKPWPAHVECRPLEDFDSGDFDLVINAIGAGDPARVSAAREGILDVTQQWDERVLKSLRPGKSAYVYLSSGIVYSAIGAAEDTSGAIPASFRLPENASPYLLSKLNAEARHRSRPDFAILDIRVFSFADSEIDIGGSFFLAQLCKSIVIGDRFVTSRADMIRDYAGAQELWDLIDCWRRSGTANLAADLYTRAPVSKSSLLKYAMTEFDIDVEYTDSCEERSTASTSIYHSLNPSAADLGYEPRRDALGVVTDVLDEMHSRKV